MLSEGSIVDGPVHAQLEFGRAPEVVEVVITPWYIMRGHQGNSAHCAVAMVLKDALSQAMSVDDIQVGPGSATIRSGPILYWYSLPESLTQWLTRFDQGIPVPVISAEAALIGSFHRTSRLVLH